MVERTQARSSPQRVDGSIFEIDSSAVPWVPMSEHSAFRPVRFARDGSGWANFIRIAPGGRIPRHRVTGGVEGYTIAGAWRDLATGCLSTTGSYTFEPAGSEHEAIVEGSEEMLVLFIARGAVEYLDDAGAVVRRDDGSTKAAAYEGHCRSQGIEPLDLTA